MICIWLNTYIHCQTVTEVLTSSYLYRCLTVLHIHTADYHEIVKHTSSFVYVYIYINSRSYIQEVGTDAWMFAASLLPDLVKMPSCGLFFSTVPVDDCKILGQGQAADRRYWTHDSCHLDQVQSKPIYFPCIYCTEVRNRDFRSSSGHGFSQSEGSAAVQPHLRELCCSSFGKVSANRLRAPDL